MGIAMSYLARLSMEMQERTGGAGVAAQRSSYAPCSGARRNRTRPRNLWWRSAGEAAKGALAKSTTYAIGSWSG